MTSILKVTEIQDPTNGNTALEIDGTGRVFMPARPVFKASITSNTTVDFSATNGIVNFDNEKIDVGGNYDPSTYKFTAPVNGIYQFQAHLRADGVGTTTYSYIFFGKNGSTVSGPLNIVGNGVSTNYQSYIITDILSLTAGDTIGVYANFQGDTSVTLYQGQSTFSGFLIG